MHRVLLVISAIGFSAWEAGAAELCFAPSNPAGLNGSTACDTPSTFVNNNWEGFTTDGQPCAGGPVNPPCAYGDPPSTVYFCWGISGSDIDPYEHVGEIGADGADLYLWLVDFGTEPLSSAEFSLAGDLELVSVTPVNGFEITHPGGLHEMRINVSCVGSPILAAVLHVSGPVSVNGSTWGLVKARYQ